MNSRPFLTPASSKVHFDWFLSVSDAPAVYEKGRVPMNASVPEGPRYMPYLTPSTFCMSAAICLSSSQVFGALSQPASLAMSVR